MSIFFLGDAFIKTAEHSESTGFDPVTSCNATSNGQAQRAQTCPEQQRAHITLLVHIRYREDDEGDQADQDQRQAKTVSHNESAPSDGLRLELLITVGEELPRKSKQGIVGLVTVGVKATLIPPQLPFSRIAHVSH
jgi:hypothetical protein